MRTPRRLPASAEGPVRPGLPVVRQIVSSQSVNALYPDPSMPSIRPVNALYPDPSMPSTQKSHYVFPSIGSAVPLEGRLSGQAVRLTLGPSGDVAALDGRGHQVTEAVG